MPKDYDQRVLVVNDESYNEKVLVVNGNVIDTGPSVSGDFLVNRNGLWVPDTIADADIPASIARDSEVTSAVAAEAVLRAAGDATKAQALTPTAVKTSAYAAAAGDFVPVDTTSGAVTVTLPAAPADRSRVAVKLVIQGGTNAVTVARGGSDVFNKAGGSTSLTLSLLSQAINLQYAASSGIWYVVADDLPLSDLDARFDAIGAAAAAQAASQPLDSDLTAIAALTTTTYGRALLALADTAALKALLAYTLSDMAVEANKGQVLGPSLTGSAETAVVANQSYIVRVDAKKRAQFNKFGLHVITTLSGNASVGVYAHDAATDLPTTQLVKSSNTALSTGRILIDIATITISPGPVWLAFSSDVAATLTFPATRSNRAEAKARTKSTVAYALPDPAATNGSLDTAPLMWLEYQ